MDEQFEDETSLNHIEENDLSESNLDFVSETITKSSDSSKKRKILSYLRIILFVVGVVFLVIYFVLGYLKVNKNDVVLEPPIEEIGSLNNCGTLYLDVKRAQCYALLAKISGGSEVCHQGDEKDEIVNYCERSFEMLLNKEEKYKDLPTLEECKNIETGESYSSNCAYGYAVEHPSICEQKDFNNITKSIVDWRESCYSTVAEETGKYSLCANLEGRDKNSCLENTFYTNYVPNDCSAMAPPYNDYCNNFFAVSLNDEVYCNEIYDSELKNECLLTTSNSVRTDENFYKDDLCVKLAYIKYTEDGEKIFVYDNKDTEIDINSNVRSFWYDENTIVFVKETSKRKYIYINGNLIGEINPSYEYLQYIVYYDGVLIFNDVDDNFIVYKDGLTKTYHNGDFSSYIEDTTDYFQKRDYLINKYMGGKFLTEDSEEGRAYKGDYVTVKRTVEILGEQQEIISRELVIDGKSTGIYGWYSDDEQTIGRHLVFEFLYNDEEHIKQNLNTVSSAIFFDGKIIENAKDPVLLQCDHKLTFESEQF